MLCRYVVGYYTVCEVPSCVNVAATTCWESGAVELRSWSWTNQGGDDASRESGCEFSRWSQCSAWGELDSTQPGLLTSWLTYSLSLCVCHDVSFMLPLHWHAVDVFCCKSLLGLNLFSKTPLQQWRVRLNYHTFVTGICLFVLVSSLYIFLLMVTRGVDLGGGWLGPPIFC